MLFLLASAALTVLPADFPEPEALEPNVRFWERVYGEWTSGQVVYHDREHMDVVYSVLELGELRLYPRPSDPTLRRARVAARRELIRERQDEIEAGLRALAGLRDAEKLGEEGVEGLDPKLRELHRALEEGGALEHLDGAVGRLRWQYGLADRFYEGLVRYDRYGDAVTERFISRGLPADLVALAFVESLFHPTVVSHAGAAGMFQFMPATGREYGLRRTATYDLRRDPLLAADAAARMLRRNYQRLGNWPLALTGYNHGPNGVARGVRAVGSHDLMDLIERYSSRTWGFASRNFYAQFLAARRTLDRRYDIFGKWVSHPQWSMTEVRLPSAIRASALLGGGCIERDVLVDYNPALLPSAFTASAALPSGFLMRVPPKSAAVFESCAASAARRGPPGRVAAAGKKRHTVVSGDTLTAIASLYGVTVEELMELNELSADGIIRIGQVLRIPSGGSGLDGAGTVDLSGQDP